MLSHFSFKMKIHSYGELRFNKISFLVYFQKLNVLSSAKFLPRVSLACYMYFLPLTFYFHILYQKASGVMLLSI